MSKQDRSEITADGVIELAIERDMDIRGSVRVYAFSHRQIVAAYDNIQTGWYDGRSLAEVVEDVLHPVNAADA